MSASPQSCRVAIVGASSLRGKELKQLLDERSFPALEVRLLDDEAAGTLTEAAGEATFIRPLEEDAFEGVRFTFFAGEASQCERNWAAAQRARSTVIDLSGALADLPTAIPWIPSLDGILPPPQPAVGKLFFSPGAAVTIACTVAAAFAPLPVVRLAMMFFQPVSERGQAGIDELETQTVKLLSFESISQEVYDAQVAFSLLARYGDASREPLGDVRAALARGVARYLAGRAHLPAIQLIQAPVFYGSAFTAYAEFSDSRKPEELREALTQAGVRGPADGEPPLSNVSVAGGNHIAVSRIEPDAHVAQGYWLWGAADNVRLPAVNAVSIAERLLAS